MAETVLFPQEEYNFVYLEEYGVYGVALVPPPFAFSLDETYKVVWDGTAYEVAAMDTSAIIGGSVSVGNGTPFGLPGNGEPFAIGYTPGVAVVFMSLTDTEQNSHTVSVYHLTEDVITYTIQSTTLKAIGDAIRAKTGGTAKITPEQMPGEIASITGGGGGSSADVRYVTFMNGDVELYRKAVAVGDDCVDVYTKGLISKPTKASTVQYEYSYLGWALSKNATSANTSALTKVTEDRTVYAAFKSTTRKYTITWLDSDGTTVLKTEQVEYGKTPSYAATKPEFVLDRWVPTPTMVTGDASYQAVWSEKPGNVVATGSCGENVTYTLYDTGKLKVSGTGPMTDYNIYPVDQQPPFYTKHKGKITSVVIEEGVTHVGAVSFASQDNLTSITVADSVITIGSGAFSTGAGLQSICVGAGVTSGLEGDSSAFSQPNLRYAEISSDNTAYTMSGICLLNKEQTELRGVLKGAATGELVVPDGVESIARLAASYAKITGLILPDSVVSVGESAFRYCKQLTRVVIRGAAQIGRMAFNNCDALTSVVLANGTQAGREAFSACSALTDIDISALTQIGDYAFYGCYGLSNVTINDAVTRLGESAFSGCTGLTEVTIGSGVTLIDGFAFSQCTALTSVTFKNTSGWFLASSAEATSGDAIDVTNPATNATNLVTTYRNKYWHRT